MGAPDITGISGWLTQREADELHRLAAGGRWLEVGSYRGRSTVALATAADYLLCCDPFDGRGTPSPVNTLADFRKTLADFHLTKTVRYIPVTVQEWAAVASVNSFDGIFLDGAHDAASVAADLETVHPFAARFGVVVLHDYGNAAYPDVKAVAHSVFGGRPDKVVDSLAVYLLDGPFPGRLLNVVTPTYRIDLLSAVGDSVDQLRAELPGWVVRWHVSVDRGVTRMPHVPRAHSVSRQHVGSGYGNGGRNAALDGIQAGWVHFLDDDNMIHPEFAAGLKAAVAEHPNAPGFVFEQVDKVGETRLAANPKAGPSQVDTAQFVFARSAIGNHRWHATSYGADYMFFRDVREKAAPVAVGGKVYYNKLRG